MISFGLAPRNKSKHKSSSSGSVLWRRWRCGIMAQMAGEPPPVKKVSPGQNKAGNANAPSAGIPFRGNAGQKGGIKKMMPEGRN